MVLPLIFAKFSNVMADLFDVLSKLRVQKRCGLIAVTGLSLCLSSCGGALDRSNSWGWYVVSPFTESGQLNLLFLLGGYGHTILISALSLMISISVGLAVAIPGLSSKRLPRLFNTSYVQLIRAIPLLPLIFWIYYGLPVMTGIALDIFWAGVLALALSDSAFEAEIFRGGLQSIGRGQIEASKSLGLTHFQTLRFVILPQALRRILPPLGNQFVYMLKMSALVSVIGYEELTRRANELATHEYRPLELYTVLILEYLLLILVVSQGVRWLERRLGSDERHSH